MQTSGQGAATTPLAACTLRVAESKINAMAPLAPRRSAHPGLQGAHSSTIPSFPGTQHPSHLSKFVLIPKDLLASFCTFQFTASATILVHARSSLDNLLNPKGLFAQFGNSCGVSPR